MSDVVNVEVASAIVVAGQIVLPGQVVEVPVSDARMLVAQGKAKWVEGAAEQPRDTDSTESGGSEGKVGTQIESKAKRKRVS